MFIQHKSGTTHYAYGRNGALTYEKNLTTGVTREYAYLNNQIIGWQETDNTGNSVKRYATTDLLGSVTTVTDHISLIKAITQYDYNTICIRSLVHDAAYKSILLTNTYLKRRKEVRGHRGEETTRRKSWFLSPNYDGMYTGKDIDSETGLTYHWNRWRSEDGSSFISEDPARDGSNWYGYCGNNPINSTDPTGLVAYGPNGPVNTEEEKADYNPEWNTSYTPTKKGPTDDTTTNTPQVNYKNFFGFLKACLENNIAPGSNAMSTTWELFMFPQPHLQGLLQEELDVYLGYYREGRDSTSCKTVSLVLHYAVLGYSPDFFLEKLKESSDVWKENGYLYEGGAPYKFEHMSKVISEKLGMNKYLGYVWLDENKTKRLSLTPLEFLRSEYDKGIEFWKRGNSPHYTAVMKLDNPFKLFVFDSMIRDRPERYGYVSQGIEPLKWNPN